eukprot:gnl/MRDRNA2_/MRDRNA2_439410_c0_seq1.p1 gnl/MRDRNA2_/MRDRNA2_439410_c0~~gnl/MRDRNA2_/MRDRNA2_439410_c0_seq1.p1  ORF type:complete len:173 (-),score=25.09 gnl/MRDRNA2_/MRDRNA2_439410_c0_seq1:90-608(-)
MIINLIPAVLSMMKSAHGYCKLFLDRRHVFQWLNKMCDHPDVKHQKLANDLLEKLFGKKKADIQHRVERKTMAKTVSGEAAREQHRDRMGRRCAELLHELQLWDVCREYEGKECLHKKGITRKNAEDVLQALKEAAEEVSQPSQFATSQSAQPIRSSQSANSPIRNQQTAKF